MPEDFCGANINIVSEHSTQLKRIENSIADNLSLMSRLIEEMEELRNKISFIDTIEVKDSDETPSTYQLKVYVLKQDKKITNIQKSINEILEIVKENKLDDNKGIEFVKRNTPELVRITDEYRKKVLKERSELFNSVTESIIKVVKILVAVGIGFLAKHLSERL